MQLEREVLLVFSGDSAQWGVIGRGSILQSVVLHCLGCCSLSGPSRSTEEMTRPPDAEEDLKASIAFVSPDYVSLDATHLGEAADLSIGVMTR